LDLGHGPTCARLRFSNAMILALRLCLFLIYCESRRFTGNVQGVVHRLHSALNPDSYPCNRELGPTAAGRYPSNIAAQFPNNAVRCSGLSKNLFCSCDDRYLSRMVCWIHVRPDSDEERIVERRLDIESPEGLPERLRPFFTFFRPYVMFYKPILFEMADCYPEVIAEIYVRKDIPFPQLMRSASSPPKLHYPHRTINLKQCTNGDEQANQRVCPITLQSFEVHSLVHVLKSDAKKVEERKSVICISDEGLRSLALSTRDHSFFDPLKREPGHLTIRGDYDIYIVTYGADDPCFSEPSGNEPGSSQSHSQAGPSGMPPFPNPPSSSSTDSELSGIQLPLTPPSSQSADSELSGTLPNIEYDTNSNFKIAISVNVLILFTFFISLFTYHWCIYTKSFSDDLYTEFISAPDI